MKRGDRVRLTGAHWGKMSSPTPGTIVTIAQMSGQAGIFYVDGKPWAVAESGTSGWLGTVLATKRTVYVLAASSPRHNSGSSWWLYANEVSDALMRKAFEADVKYGHDHVRLVQLDVLTRARPSGDHDDVHEYVNRVLVPLIEKGQIGKTILAHDRWSSPPTAQIINLSHGETEKASGQ